MGLVVLSAIEHPILPDEKWFYVHPNNANVELFIPAGAAAICIRPLLGKFLKDKPYGIANFDKEHGWISLKLGADVYKMPLYLFARHFDAEAFVRHVSFESGPRSYRYNPDHHTWSDNMR